MDKIIASNKILRQIFTRNILSVNAEVLVILWEEQKLRQKYIQMTQLSEKVEKFSERERERRKHGTELQAKATATNANHEPKTKR